MKTLNLHMQGTSKFFKLLTCVAVVTAMLIMNGQQAIAQNLGVGIATPQEKADINGAIKIGNTTTTNAGTIRWNGTDFEGYDGSQWINLGVAATGTCGLSIGDTYAGGIIFYLDGTGCHGLVAKANDETGTYEWQLQNFDTWALASGIYGGAQNTKKSIARALVNSSTCPAASVCDNLSSGGYTDWYLPSKDELDMMYVNLHLHGLGGFASNYYWSSTEYDAGSAWIQYFSSGLQYYGNKYGASYVRAVRAF